MRPDPTHPARGAASMVIDEATLARAERHVVKVNWSPDRLLSVDGAKGDLAQAIGDAVSDGVITDNELRRISRAGDQMQETVIILLRKLRDVARGGKHGAPAGA